MSSSQKFARWSPEGRVQSEARRSDAPDFARLQNASDFVIRTVLEVVPEPASGSAWLRNDEGLTEAAFAGETLVSRETLAAYLIAAYGTQAVSLNPEEDGVRTLGPVAGHFASAMILPVPNSAGGFLFFTSDVPTAFGSPQRGQARRMAAHLGQYWAR